MDRAVYGMSGDNEWIGESISASRGAGTSSDVLSGVLPREHEHLKTPGPERSKNERFVQVPKASFWDLFIRPAYKGIKQQVLAWVVDQTWGQHDWEKNENRRATSTPTCTTKIAQDIGASRWEVSRALAKLRAEGILIENEIGGVGIDKHRLAECAQKRTLSSKNVRKTARACAQERTPKSVNAIIDRTLPPLLDYLDSSQTRKESPAVARRVNYEFDALDKAVREKFSPTEKPRKIQLALNECARADLHPLDLIRVATHNWFGFIRSACAKPDAYRDHIRTYAEFVEEVRPANPAAVALVEKAVSADV